MLAWSVTASAQDTGAAQSPAPSPLPHFSTLRPLLPSPVYDENPLWVETYWKAWELAFRNFHDPAPGSGFVSQFIDAAFNSNIFLWDTAFMTMFCNIAHGLVPGISSLDNFYAKQHPDGEISREINRTTGVDFAPWINAEGRPLYSAWGFNTGEKPVTIRYSGRDLPPDPPALTLDALNNPIPAWAELESFRYTGDRSRLAAVRTPLVRYYRALQTYLRQGNGLYVTDWASMDNSPRNPGLLGGGVAVDISSQIVLFARNLAEIDSILGGASATWTAEADTLSARINALLWKDGFYYDRAPDGSLIPVRTIAAFWTLLAGVATPERAVALGAELQNPSTFGRVHPVPSCAADEPGYVSGGGYWRGAVWPSTNTMVIRGLKRYGFDDLARTIALKHVAAVADVFMETGTIWENYAPDAVAPGRHADGTPVVRDMVGWSGIGPILYFMEYAVGLVPDAPANRLTWTIRSTMPSGCDRYRFNGHVVSLLATPEPGGRGVRIDIRADGSFTLEAHYRGRVVTTAVPPGTSAVTIN
jgi:glycogen debranching enzyme